MKYTYQAIRSQQADSEKKLILFSASASEINMWSGIPQKKRFGTGEETAGFQREQNVARLKSLSDFYSDKENIIQKFQENHISQENTNDFIGLLQNCEKARYMPTSDGNMQLHYEKLQQLVQIINV